MPQPSAQVDAERRLVLLTLALETSIAADAWDEAANLLAERDALIASLELKDSAIDLKALETVQASEARIMGWITSRKHEMLSELRESILASRAVRSYTSARNEQAYDACG